MEWYVWVAHFFAGAFLANGIPHFVQGIGGRKFPTPFASPPGRGLSPAPVNVVWGSANFLLAWGLLTYVPAPDPRPAGDRIIIAAAFFLTALGLGTAFGSRLPDR